MRTFCSSLVLFIVSIGCSGPFEGDPGQAVFTQPLANGNTFTCNTCHALEEPAADGFHRPGHALGDATRRPTFKNGQLTTVLDAVNTCVTEWMGAPPLAENDREWQDLLAFLDGQAGIAEAPALTFEIVPPPADVSGGDVAAGGSFFNSACAICHGSNATGTNQAPSLRFTELDPDYMARRIRTSGAPDSPTYTGLTGGRMPFWSADRISDPQVRNVVAFLEDLQAGGGGTTGETIGQLGDCESTHARVGWSTTLSRFAHGVGGTATVVNDCSIQVTNFNFDGGGIDVRAYGATGGNYDSGFSMSADLVRPGNPYQNATLNIQLPSNRTLDDVDGLSIWCVPVGVSFGDGLLAP